VNERGEKLEKKECNQKLLSETPSITLQYEYGDGDMVILHSFKVSIYPLLGHSLETREGKKSQGTFFALLFRISY